MTVAPKTNIKSYDYVLAGLEMYSLTSDPPVEQEATHSSEQLRGQGLRRPRVGGLGFGFHGFRVAGFLGFKV